ncbi:hypothetical protein [Vibrio bivalvicida]|uniref:Transcriptional regulator VspR n=1 Tax=Vibrio bivalvicida TaxID=1276888 RepID=A0A177Y0Q7_9VIBR|nr:hypothetical protein [Vibrio bivalvicida]OAJ94449.1 hypothetical protein APB76_09720 [Vibrio bivalvicida]
MSKEKKHQVNKDIYDYLVSVGSDSFTVTQVRNAIYPNSAIYLDKHTARTYVSRQLKRLEILGVIDGEGQPRTRIYTKTPKFDLVKFQITERQHPDQSVLNQLEREIGQLELDLNSALTEVKEYEILMTRSEILGPMLKPLCKEARTLASSLVAKLKVREKAIELLSSNS